MVSLFEFAIVGSGVVKLAKQIVLAPNLDG